MNRAQLALLDEVIADLKAHPERHNQEEWVIFKGQKPPEVTPALDCGSTFCIAGAVVVRSGAKPLWTKRYAGKDVWSAYGAVTTDGEHRSIAEYARKLLGIGAVTADRLFWESNTMDDIEDIRDELAVGVKESEAASELTTLAQDMGLDAE